MSLPTIASEFMTTATTIPTTQAVMSSPRTTCCEGGRPVMTDPHTGHTVCSCQYSSSLLSYPRVAGLTPESIGYSSAAYATQGYSALSVDPSAFYSPLSSAYGYKESSDAWRGLTQPTAYYPYDPAMSAYPYGNSYGGMDLNGARRKNATRESTNTLKAWLNEHRKNPYPTKGEKIMLAIITKMTLTQVSTWFANARRRLKKENKMTWSPRNRCDEDGDNKGDSDGEDNNNDDDEKPGSLSPGDETTSSDTGRSIHDADLANAIGPSCMEQKPNLAKLEDTMTTAQIKQAHSPLSDLNARNDVVFGADSPHKPRIWSLAHTATSTSPPPPGMIVEPRSPGDELDDGSGMGMLGQTLDSYHRSASLVGLRPTAHAGYTNMSPSQQNQQQQYVASAYAMPPQRTMPQSGQVQSLQPQALSPTLLNNGRMTSASSQYMTNLGNSMNRGFMTSSSNHAMNHGYSSYVPSHQNMVPQTARLQNGLSEIKGEPKDNMLLSETLLTNDCTAFKPVMKL